MIALEILDYNKNYIKQLRWFDGMPVPNKGDTMLIHLGDNPKNEYRVNVLHREFDDTKNTIVRIITDFVKFKDTHD